MISKKFIILGLLPISIFAFKPSVSHFPVWSDVKINHLTITEDALKNITVNGEKLTFSPEALKEIKKANAGVDENEAEIHSAHCDAESIGGEGGCSERLVNLKHNIIGLLTKTQNVKSAREDLGKALHTLQDFYAHSNWVNMDEKHRGTVIYSKLTDTEPYLPKQDKYEGVADSSDYKTCEWSWGILPGTLIPDWRPTPKLKFEKRGEKIVTTGWFAGILGTADPKHYKCDHGIAKGNGLNKDTQHQKLHLEASIVAMNHSKKYVEEIITKVLADKSGGMTPEELAKNVSKFLGDKKSSANLGFVVDTTGSMGSTITGVKNAMTQTVNKLKSEDRDIENFYLISYGDPRIGSVLTATNVDAMLSNINTVRLGVPDYGGDTPELALDGLLKVVTVANDNTELYLYTDANTKNHSLEDTIIKLAKSKHIKINFFLSGYGDSSYNRIASATGGKIISYAHSVSGAEGTFAHINPSFDGNLEALLKIVGKIPGSSSKTSKSLKLTKSMAKECNNEPDCGDFVYAIANTKNRKSISYRKLTKTVGANTVEHDINVDNSSEKVLINVQMNPIGTVVLLRPDGTEAVEGDSDITIVKTSASESITVTTPTVGTWKIQITGNAGQDYSVDVDMVTEIRIIDFSFAEVKGRAGHEGLFPVDGQPLNSIEQYITLTVAGDIKTLAMKIIALDGTKISDVALTETSKNDISADYFAKFKLPSQPFRIVIVGEDIAGAKFERVYNQVYVGQTVSVKPVTKKPILLQANKASELLFTITNTGVKDTFVLSATKEDGSAISLDKTEITLENNESKEIRVQFTTSSDIGEKDTYSVTLSAQSKTNSESKNYAVYKAEVDDEDLDNDGVSDKMEQFIYDGNKDGKDDYKQSSVISILSESGIGFTFELPKSNKFNGMFIGEVSNSVKSSIEGVIPFGLFDFTVQNIVSETSKMMKLTTNQMKIIYSGNIYPTEYYKYDDTSSSWVKDETAIFEKGYAIITLTKTNEKGFFVFNNQKPSAYVAKQKINKNASITLDLLKNSHDEDGDTIRIISIDNKSHKNGTITKVVDSDSKVIYTASQDFTGTDYFQYKITDDKGGYASIDVEIEIQTKKTTGGSGLTPTPTQYHSYDFDKDGNVDIDDIMKVVNAWNTKYNSDYDFNHDGVIDIKDIMKIASLWGI